MKTAIITDSTAYISEEIRSNHHIHMVPLSVIFGEETYREEVDMTANQYFEKLKKQKSSNHFSACYWRICRVV